MYDPAAREPLGAEEKHPMDTGLLWADAPYFYEEQTGEWMLTIGKGVLPLSRLRAVVLPPRGPERSDVRLRILLGSGYGQDTDGPSLTALCLWKIVMMLGQPAGWTPRAQDGRPAVAALRLHLDGPDDCLYLCHDQLPVHCPLMPLGYARQLLRALHQGLMEGTLQPGHRVTVATFSRDGRCPYRHAPLLNLSARVPSTPSPPPGNWLRRRLPACLGGACGGGGGR